MDVRPRADALCEGLGGERADQPVADLGYPADEVTAVATALASCGYTVEIPGGPLFEDGFESGDTAEWSAVVP